VSKSSVQLAYARAIPDDYTPSWLTRAVISLLTISATVCALWFAAVIVVSRDPMHHAISATSYAVLFAILGVLWAIGRSPLMLKWDVAVLMFIAGGWGLLRAGFLQ